MSRYTHLAFFLCLMLIASAFMHSARAATIEEQTLIRLDAMEKENAALKQRLKRLERTLPATASGQNQARGQSDPPRGQTGGLDLPDSVTMGAHAQDNGPAQFYKNQPVVGAPTPRFEVSGSLAYLQPGSGNLEYATLVSPLPLPSPNWANQALKPDFDPAFRLGFRYMPDPLNDIQVNWAHLRSSDYASVSATPTQMVGPSYEIGPDSAVFKNAQGALKTSYDSVNIDAGHTFCAACVYQLRIFGGAEFARIGQNVSGMFQSGDGLTTASNTNNSLFTGAGPRLGVKGQYAIGDLQLFGEAAGAALIGTSQNSINFTATSPALVGLGIANNTQSLTSPNATQVVPSFDARFGTAYVFPVGNYGQFKIELGYQAAAYMNAVNHYALTQVAVNPVAGTVGVFLATAQHVQSTFTTQGPYLTAAWSF